MQVVYSTPTGVPGCDLYDRLAQRWQDLDSTAIDHRCLPGEIHGDRLVRLWKDIFVNERGAKEGDGKYLISENDFIIDPEFLEKLRRWPWANVNVIFARYQMRNPDNLELRPHEGLVGAWFLAFNLRHPEHPVKRWPPIDWLRAGGPYNDAANLAFKESCEAGSFGLRNVAWLDARTVGDKFLGVDYSLNGEHVGLHTFWGRELSAPKDKILLPQLPEYTAGEHVRQIQLYLDKVDA